MAAPVFLPAYVKSGSSSDSGSTSAGPLVAPSTKLSGPASCLGLRLLNQGGLGSSEGLAVKFYVPELNLHLITILSSH